MEIVQQPMLKEIVIRFTDDEAWHLLRDLSNPFGELGMLIGNELDRKKATREDKT
jgi:hypothetical protein